MFWQDTTLLVSLTNIFCQSDMTGVVVDIGDGAPHIVPVVNGYVIGSSIKSFPLSGSDVTQFVMQLLQVFNFLPTFSWGYVRVSTSLCCP